MDPVSNTSDTAVTTRDPESTGPQPPKTPVFAASLPRSARPDENPGEGSPKPLEPRRIDPEGISGYLAKIVPKPSLGMAVLRFRSAFPNVSHPSELHPGKFAEWLESLPIAHV